MRNAERKFYTQNSHNWLPAVKFTETRRKLCLVPTNGNLYHYSANNPVKYTDPDGREAGDPFNSIEEAALDFANTYNDDSIHYNVEYFSAIYSYIDEETGKILYSYNIPNKGDGDSVEIDLSVEHGQTVVSTVHAHAAYDSQYKNNEPSDDDFDTMISNTEYVSTPNGSLIEYHKNKTQNILRTDINSDEADPTRKNRTFSFKENIYK